MLRSSAARLDNNKSHHGLLFPSWLRKKESSWSLRSLSKVNRFGSSTVSLPLSIVSSSISSVVIEDEDEDEEDVQPPPTPPPPPPSYDDKSHPWTFQFPKSLLNRIILPREEEGKEILPEYECTVQKMNYLKVKCELSQPEIKSKSRSWKYLYVQIYGTKIMAFVQNPNKKRRYNLEPIWTHSMHGAQAIVASDYIKERYVIRLSIQHGPQYLMTTQTDKDKNDWIAIMESSINISSDLDIRSMPTFITLISRRRRRNNHDTTTATTARQQQEESPSLL